MPRVNNRVPSHRPKPAHDGACFTVSKALGQALSKILPARGRCEKVPGYSEGETSVQYRYARGRMSRFLQQFESYFAHRTDAPPEFGHAGGLMALSTIALGRRWLTTGIHPNVYFLLVGPSSRDRKSTSIGLAMRMVEHVLPDRIGPSDFTPEGLLFRMRKKAGVKPRNKMIIALSEFGQHLATSQKSYGGGLGALMCQLYDGETIERARSGKKTLLVINPRLNMFGGCAYGMLEKYCAPVDWEGGFFARMCFIKAEDKPRPAYASIPVPIQAMEDACRAALTDLNNELKANVGAMSLSAPALQLYESSVHNIPDTSGDVAVVAQRERLLNAIPRFALLYQIDDNPAIQIQPAAMQKAIDFAMKAWATFELTYKRCSGTLRSRFTQKIWKAISDEGNSGLGRRDLARKFNANLDDLQVACKLLLDLGIVKLETITVKDHLNQSRQVYKILEPFPK